MSKKEFVMNSLNDLEQCANDLLDSYKDKRVFAFYGEMGSGKTTFIKQLCKKLNVVDQTNSPTFAIINEYETSGKENVYHADFYRIKDEEEAFQTGCVEYFDSGNYCFIEWPERIENLLPEETVKVRINLDNDKRTLTVEN